MRKNMYKTAIVALTMAAVTLGTVSEAQARIGSGRVGSSSVSSARPTSSSSGRLGGGSSMGMQRSSVMNSVRTSPRPAPAPSYTQNYRQAPAPAPTPAPQPTSKRSWVAPAAAGLAAGALAGYALGHSNNQPTQAPQYQQPAPQYQQPAPQQAPAYADQASAYQQAAPAPQYHQSAPSYSSPSYAAPQSSGGGFGFGSLLILLLLIGVGIFAYRRYVQGKADVKADLHRTGNAAKASVDTFKSSFNAPASAASSTSPAAASMASGIDLNKGAQTSPLSPELEKQGEDLMDRADNFYRELQALNNQANLAELRNRTTAQMYEDLERDIRGRIVPSQTEVFTLQYELVNLEKQNGGYIASVRYTAEIQEGPNEGVQVVDDVFHFQKDSGILSSWKLAGVEAV